uniref:Uncharacterized protein n=1 Tax=Melopsittacus undulatus TaxID=13146 RepID=A0A8V5GQV8_MELUD
SSAPPPEKNEALEAQQQMSLFQNRIREQNAHLEMLREKAHDLEVQLESSQKNAKDKENTFAQMEENMEDTIQQLCESTEEKEQDVKSLQDLVASERLSVLQCALSVRDSEIRELKNELKDICRRLENLRAELEKCLGPRKVWQTDVTEYPPFGRLKYLHVSLDTHSHAV